MKPLLLLLVLFSGAIFGVITINSNHSQDYIMTEEQAKDLFVPNN